MTESKRQVEVFVAGCPLCKEAAMLLKGLACPSCEVVFHDLRGGDEVFSRAQGYGVNAVPAVVIDGQLVECCVRGTVEEETLRASGIGVACECGCGCGLPGG